MKEIIVIAALFVVSALSAQTDKICQSNLSFKKIQIYDGIDVILERGDSNSICSATGTKLDLLSISSSDGTLRIRKIQGVKYEKVPSLKISYNELRCLEGYGNSTISTKNLIKGDSVNVVLKSGTTLYASFDVKYLQADIIEGSLFKADGYAIEQQIQVATKATFAGGELEGKTADIKSSTGGKAKVNIEEKLKATANSGGYISYRGTPSLGQKTSMGGKIVREQED